MNNMYYERKAVVATAALWLVTIVFYYNIFNLMQTYTTRPYYDNLNMRRRIYKRKEIPEYNGNEDFLINTPGCTIPNYSKSLDFKETSHTKGNCDRRVVHVEKISEDEVIFHIDYDKIIKKQGQSFKCSYQYAVRSDVAGEEDNNLKLTELWPFKNGERVKLKQEVIAVSCDLMSPKNKKISNYNDAYLILKKKPTNFFNTVGSRLDKVILMKENWNVLILGMDTMSRGRAYHSLPKTVEYLQGTGWLDYRGYQKIAVNTFPNIMAILSGKNATSAYHSCSQGMDYCEQSLIWNKFKEAGYMTAFGEDNLNLPDTFAPYKGFKYPPTDHYPRPLFLIGEHRSGNVICTRTKPSASHLLNYTLQFVEAYKQDSFFGHFWINSYSHNLENLPTLFEHDLIDFFKNLKELGVLHNTFVFFLSDHGVRFGPKRTPGEAYYEERLPMLFMWVPYEFREIYPEEYDNLQLNQFRFTTPYDLHATLVNIMIKTNNYIESVPPEACPQCTSLTEEVSPNRTCEMAHVDQKWCSCHVMNKADTNDIAANQSVNIAVKYVLDRASSIKTKNCTTCSPLKLKKVIRNDWYKNGNKTYYIVAFQFTPGDVAFEATVENYGDEFNILPPTDTITQYNVRGKCVINVFDSAYCVCLRSKCKRDHRFKRWDFYRQQLIYQNVKTGLINHSQPFTT